MAIKLTCPQCQTSYSVPDERQGQQVRCKKCSRVFLADGTATAISSSPAARRQPSASAKEEPLIAPRQSRTRSEGPGARSGVLWAFLFMTIGGGGVAAWFVLNRDKPEPTPVAKTDKDREEKPPVVTPADKQEQDKDRKPPPPEPKKVDDDPPVKKPKQPELKKPEPMQPEPMQPEKPETKPEPKPADEPPRVVGVTKENYDQIDKGMHKDDLIKLLGQPAKESPSAMKKIEYYLIFRATGTAPRITVGMFKDRVVDKSTDQGWPTVYGNTVAKNPPPPDRKPPDRNPPEPVPPVKPPPDKPVGKPNAKVTKESFDKIHAEMTFVEVLQLFGQPSKTDRGDGRTSDTVRTWIEGDTTIRVSTRHGKVVAKENNQGWPVNLPKVDVVAKKPDPMPLPPKPDPRPKPDPIPQNDKLTRENYDRIAKGMTEDAVKTLLGLPADVQDAQNQRILRWQGGGTTISVVFVKGGAFLRTNSRGWPEAFAPVEVKPAVAVTRENFDRIDKDMTVEALLKLMGQPSEKQGNDSDGAYTWKGPGGTVFVVFGRGKVKLKENQQNWPVTYPKEVAAAKAAEGFTQENFDRIDKGMSEEDLLALTGPPTQSNKLGGGGEADARMFWMTKDNGSVIVELLKGQVVKKSTNKGWKVVYPFDAVREKSFTKESYEKIDKGMTLDELRALLGPPTRTWKTMTVGKEQHWEWSVPQKGKITIVGSQDKVVSKQNGQLWATTYPKEVAEAEKNRVVDVGRAILDLGSDNAATRMRAIKDLLERVKPTKEHAPAVTRAVYGRLKKAQGEERELLNAVYKAWLSDEEVDRLVRIASQPVKDGILDDRGKERLAAAETLAGMKHPRAAGVIAPLLKSFFEREAAARMLLDLGPELVEKAVLAYYHDPDQGIHGKAREILKTFKTTDVAIFDQAVADLDHAVAHQRALAVQTILAAPVDPTKRKEVALALDRAVARSEAVASGGAMIALKKWGTADNVPALVKQLRSKVEQARQVAMEALGEIKDPTGAEETAKLLLVNSGLVQDRQNAQKSLIAMGAVAEKATLPYLSNRDAGVRLAACKVLEAIGTKASVAALTTEAARGPGEVTQAARAAITAIEKR